jgi:glycosyltransferase involved in cell wall biosynthesis
MVSNRVAHKNLETLSEAAAVLERRGMVIAVAGGIDREVFRNIPGIDFAERRLGRVSDAELRALYENAACLLFPLRYEGFGPRPIEAMACGCPVLAAHGGAVEEICADRASILTTATVVRWSARSSACWTREGLAEDLRMRERAHAAGLIWAASARALGDVVRRLR